MRPDASHQTGGESRVSLYDEVTNRIVAQLGIVPRVRHTDYLANWLAVLKADSRAIFYAASQASKASNFLLAIPAQAQAGAPVAAYARATPRSVHHANPSHSFE
ncbi:MAG TPA: zincin-like metallopeptidase domain-containing protein [Rhizomicrobium sp.]|nr:zincin-like metallopeptidase domain-containing protein [Rhizomicrobium sp.]